MIDIIIIIIIIIILTICVFLSAHFQISNEGMICKIDLRCWDTVPIEHRRSVSAKPGYTSVREQIEADVRESTDGVG